MDTLTMVLWLCLPAWIFFICAAMVLILRFCGDHYKWWSFPLFMALILPTAGGGAAAIVWLVARTLENSQ